MEKHSHYYFHEIERQVVKITKLPRKTLLLINRKVDDLHLISLVYVNTPVYFNIMLGIKFLGSKLLNIKTEKNLYSRPLLLFQ